MEAPMLGYVILAISVVMSLLMQLFQNIVVDVDKRESYMRELNKWREKLSLYRKTGDPKLLAEIQRDSSRIQLIQQELSKETMKAFIPSIFVFLVFLWITQWIGRNTIVIVAPFYIPLDFLGTKIFVNDTVLLGFNVIWWYFFSALPITSITNTILRLYRLNKSLQRIIRRRRVKKKRIKTI